MYDFAHTFVCDYLEKSVGDDIQTDDGKRNGIIKGGTSRGTCAFIYTV